jgi:hypothetical protein
VEGHTITIPPIHFFLPQAEQMMVTILDEFWWRFTGMRGIRIMALALQRHGKTIVPSHLLRLIGVYVAGHEDWVCVLIEGAIIIVRFIPYAEFNELSNEFCSSFSVPFCYSDLRVMCGSSCVLLFPFIGSAASTSTPRRCTGNGNTSGKTVHKHALSAATDAGH